MIMHCARGADLARPRYKRGRASGSVSRRAMRDSTARGHKVAAGTTDHDRPVIRSFAAHARLGLFTRLRSRPGAILALEHPDLDRIGRLVRA